MHRDFSNTSLIVIKRDENELSLKNKFGIIDFEYCHVGPIVFELSICIAYLITNADENYDKLAISKDVYEGYVLSFPLLKVESDVLYWAGLARLMTSYVNSHYHISKQRENKEYIQVQASKCPDLIKLLWRKEKASTLAYWVKSIDSIQTKVNFDYLIFRIFSEIIVVYKDELL